VDVIKAFSIYPCEDHGGVHAMVRVFHSLNDMRKHIKNTGDANDKALGVCRQWEGTLKNGERDPMFAEVCFAVNMMTTYIVPHEILHAAYAWARYMGVDVVAEEEKMCEVNGYMMSQMLAHMNQMADELAS
jgi:hypothetical protein